MNIDNNFAPVASKEGSYASAAKPMRFPTGAFLFRRDGRAWLIASVLKTDTGNTDVGSNPTLSATFCGSARIDVHPGASQPVSTGNDEAGLSAEMFRDKPHPLPKPSREAAARPKCAGNETGYKPHGGSSLAGVAESFAGSDGLQPVTLSKTQRQTGGYLGAAAKPDSSPAKISPKCCLPFIITNYCAHRWGKTTPNGKQVCKRCGTVKGFKTTNHCAA